VVTSLGLKYLLDQHKDQTDKNMREELKEKVKEEIEEQKKRLY